MTKTFSLKDVLFNTQTVTQIANLFAQADPAFKADLFIQNTLAQFPQLELKERSTCIAKQLHALLPNNYNQAVTVLLKALPPPLDPHKTDDDFGQFVFASYSEFIALYGCSEEYFEVSLQALKEITKRFSVEYALQSFINAFPQKTLAELTLWAADSNYHVRRAASEGTRPRLPWGKKICYTAKDTMPLLNILHKDSTRFVTRSVANHLNDYSKTDPRLVLKTLTHWQTVPLQTQKELQWLTKHALRTLIKQGNTEALALLGYKAKPAIRISNFTVQTPVVLIGTALEYSFSILAQKKSALLINCIIEYQTKRGTLQPKVFKISQDVLQINEQKMYTKRIPFKIMTTKKLYVGLHTIHIQVNGKTVASGSFMVRE